jgi:hypothetical protein
MWTDRLTKSNPVNRLEVSISDSRNMERDKVLTTRGSPPVLYRWEAVRQVELSKALKRTAFTASADGTFGTSHVELLALGARDLEGDFLQHETPADRRASMSEIHLALGSEINSKGRFTLLHLFAERSTEARLAA